MTQVTEPFPIFYDDDGTPLENGMIYIGQANQDPRTNPVTVYRDEARTVPIAQPIITLDGRPAFQGAPVNLYVNEPSYSISVQNRFGSPVTSATDIGLSAQDVSFLPAGTGAALRTVEAKLRDVVSVKDFGAVGDGTTNDQAAIQAALNAAALVGGEVIFPVGTYRVNTSLLVPNGVSKITGAGGTILAGGAISVLYARSVATGASANVNDLDIVGLHIDCGGFAANAIHVENGQSILITNNLITNIVDGYGILCRSLAGTSQRNSSRIRIIGNQIVANNNVFGLARYAISLDILNADLQVSPHANELAYWDATFTAAVPTVYADQCVVANNWINGGRYGIALNGARRTAVSGNVTQNNTRGISVQHDAKWNTITGNVIIDPASSGVHIAFGSNNNTVSGNFFRGTSNGEALIQLRNGAVDNLIVGNNIRNDGAAGNEYFIYCGLKSDRNSIKNNRLMGACSKAAICIESAWNTTTTCAFSYAFGKASIVASNTNAGITGVVVTGNTIEMSRALPAIVVVAEIDDATGTGFSVTNAVISGNEITNNTPSKQFSIFENSGQVTGLSLIGNAFNPAAVASRFDQPRGRAHYSIRSSNAVLDASGAVSFSAGDTSPDVSFGGGFYATANSSATSITTFDGGANGDEITVRIDANTTLVHDNALLRLRSNANVVGSSANEFLTFRRTSNIWFEVSRNF